MSLTQAAKAAIIPSGLNLNNACSALASRVATPDNSAVLTLGGGVVDKESQESLSSKDSRVMVMNLDLSISSMTIQRTKEMASKNLITSNLIEDGGHVPG